VYPHTVDVEVVDVLDVVLAGTVVLVVVPVGGTVDVVVDAVDVVVACATATMISLEAALVPLAFVARMRTKYLPGGTPLAVKTTAVSPVLKFAISRRPDAEPASTM